jgi:PPP family 3-phenylpropionic acid transporter
VKDLGLPAWVIGVSASIGVASEILVMFTWPRWGAHWPTRRVLLWVFGASAVRWALMAVVTHPLALSAAALFHGLTFGAFYLASVGYLSKHAPGSLRATGQALFAAATFGVGGVIGYRVSGALYDALGGPKLFAVATTLALLPIVPLLLATRLEVQAERPRP